MFSRIYSVAMRGLSGVQLDIEADIARGLPAFSIVGLPDLATQESRERVRSAIKNSGYEFPIARITVNLAPADVRKKGAFDLPIALALLARQRDFSQKLLDTSLFLGELALDGTLRSVASVLPSAIFAREQGFARIFVPAGNAREAAMIPDIDVVWVETLSQAVGMLSEDIPLRIVEKDTDIITSLASRTQERTVDFSSVIGHESAKRALLIAAAWGHNILMSGPPGSGKTMLASAFAGIQPPMRFEEMLDVSRIYSVAGLLCDTSPLIASRPFRRVHHTASAVSIVGGGRESGPGEISLAHRGVLFLDELLEFDTRLLETLRQPLEDSEITITRANASCTYPARFQLVAAMNPCPCGYLGDPEIPCRDSPREVERYRRRLSGPLLDRMDIVLHLPRVKTDEIRDAREGAKSSSSEELRNRVEQAREIQAKRFENAWIFTNSEMKNTHIEIHCQLQSDSADFLDRAMRRFSLSTRAYFRLLRVARTIADIEACETITLAHISEALSYRQSSDMEHESG